MTVQRPVWIAWAIPTALVLLLLGGCAGSGSDKESWNSPSVDDASLTQSRMPQHTVAVLGMVKASGVNTSLNRAEAVDMLVNALQEEGQRSVMSLDQVYARVGSERLEGILANLSENGTFSEDGLQTLMAAGLPPRVLVTRLDDDEIEQLPPEIAPREHVRDALLNDRERVVLNTRRNVMVTAAVLDLRNGQLVWQKAYRAQPVSTSVGVHYTGSNLGTSLAAAFANVMVNGLQEPEWPSPPPLSMALQAIARKIAVAAPI